MKTNLIISFLIFNLFGLNPFGTFLILPFVHAQTSIPAGNVSGTWTKIGSPYQIQGTIQIPNGQTLAIDPGVKVEFQGQHKLNVQGQLLAIGTTTDTIIFTTTDTTNGWRGIRFDNTPTTNDTSRIKYCKLIYGKATGTSPDDKGGAFYLNNFSKAIISNSTLTNCSATYGGSIFCYTSSPIIQNNIISNNTASSAGGGIYCNNGSNPMISNNIINYNSCANGGGIYCFNDNNPSSPTIINNTISYNGLSGGLGGGIRSVGSSSNIVHNVISNNLGGPGAGIFTTGSEIISNNIISNNISNAPASSGWGGGGIFCSNNETITNNVISNNSASFLGGGICCYMCNSTISNNVISNNRAQQGGAVFCTSYGSYAANPNLLNNTVSNNSAQLGGALFFTSPAISISPTLRNTIFWRDSAATGNEVYINDQNCKPNFYYCDVQGGYASFGLNGNSYIGTYQNNIDADPKFVAPSVGAGSGFDGVTADWSLQPSSPCIDHGDPTGAYPANDIAGNPRVRICRIDIGAYEYNTGVPLSGTITQTQQVLCHGEASAALTVNAVGGSAGDAYSYAWSNSLTTSSVTGLLAGVHSVTVSTTVSQCQVVASYTVSEPAQIIISPSHKDDNACNAINDGIASVNIAGGVIPYTYLWVNNSTASSISGLALGNYSVTVTDNHACSVTNIITIGSLSTSITSNISIKPDTCIGNVGKITTAPSGGLGAYTFAWSNGSTTKNISSLSAGNYSVTIADSLGCAVSNTAMVGTYTSTITPALTSKPDTCVGYVGLAISNPTGGTSPYSYLWSNTNTTKNISLLASNNYLLTVTDKNGCSITGSVLVGSFTNTITTTFISILANCHKPNGGLTVNPGGGTNPYSYVWSNGGSVQTLNNVFAGNYTVNVTDKNGCTKTTSSAVGTATTVATPEICMITVDSLSKYNLIIWDKKPFAGTAVKSFIIYRDTANNNYAPIGKTPFDSLSQFIDTARTLYTANGDPNFSSWRYKIAMEDSCGNISTKSLYHQSLFIQNNNANFNWTDYKIEGQPIPIPSLSNYLFQRDDFSTGNYVTIATLSASSNLSTDPQYSTFQNTANWRVKTQWSISCTPSHKNDVRMINTTRSNTIKKVIGGVHENELDRMVSVYPNPSSGKLTISSLEKIFSIEVINLLGETVFLKTINNNQASLNLEESPGIYFLHLKTSKGTAVKKIIIE